MNSKMSTVSANKAKVALQSVYGNNDDVTPYIRELLLDLRHLCHKQNLDFAELQVEADENFNVEMEFEAQLRRRL